MVTFLFCFYKRVSNLLIDYNNKKLYTVFLYLCTMDRPVDNGIQFLINGMIVSTYLMQF